MGRAGDANIRHFDGEEYTCITFRPDLPKFKMSILDKDTVALMTRRAYDIAGATKGVRVFFNGKRLPVGYHFLSLTFCKPPSFGFLLLNKNEVLFVLLNNFHLTFSLFRNLFLLAFRVLHIIFTSTFTLLYFDVEVRRIKATLKNFNCLLIKLLRFYRSLHEPVWAKSID